MQEGISLVKEEGMTQLWITVDDNQTTRQLTTTQPTTTKPTTTQPTTTKPTTTQPTTTKPTTTQPITEAPVTKETVTEREQVKTTTEEFVEPEEVYVEEREPDRSDDYLVYDLTAYWTAENGHSTKSGRYATEGRTVACNSLPLYTRIYIEGFGEYIVEDIGGMEDYKIDIFFEDPHPNFYCSNVRVWVLD